MQFLQLSHFAGHVGEQFTVDIEGQQAIFTLVEATPLPSQPWQGMVREPYSLVFRNAAAIVFAQRTYGMSHPAMGEFGIFLVPVARDLEGFLYQAVFN